MYLVLGVYLEWDTLDEYISFSILKNLSLIHILLISKKSNVKYIELDDSELNNYKASISNELPHYFKTVSYTHLDVYKRQGWYAAS